MAEPDIILQKPDLKSLRVLIIDDEPFIRKLVGRMLTELGVVQVIEANDGADGLDRLQTARKPIDVVLCDLEMPKMNGFQFVKALRSNPDIENPNVPVVILTGHSDEDSVHDAVGLGIHGYLVKPVSKAALEKRILSAVSKPAIDPKKLG